ncbi:TK/EPH protein kinase [Salpingoeca rosetta]|uniref:TK/EPH protein kinase n=1 Tax=Salpingoeca rosetta (strain ATCC 50818 / BSB-021) TaxID=946362 RepID=F2US51_SALR5|nr:TK/EPH protein kinase [Salpingoeca rosetta]EGD80456.1 TK/EPH protein kinase [Salpingoeca rosetta]|eukprot:XP_004988020.1 TK/EPH protein kinase [Salpingoeca rosetta]
MVVVGLRKSDIRLTELVSFKGGFGFFHGVARVRADSTFHPISAKLLKEGYTPAERTNIVEEATILSDLRHVNVLSVHGMSKDGPIILVHEPTKRGYLSDFLAKNTTDNSLLRKIALDIVDALIYLSSRNVVHWDVAARNVLVTEDVRCKLANFARRKEADDPAPEGWYTAPTQERLMRWSPPEVVGRETQQQRRMSVQEDIWGFGLFLYELFTAGLQDAASNRSSLYEPLADDGDGQPAGDEEEEEPNPYAHLMFEDEVPKDEIATENESLRQEMERLRQELLSTLGEISVSSGQDTHRVKQDFSSAYQLPRELLEQQQQQQQQQAQMQQQQQAHLQQQIDQWQARQAQHEQQQQHASPWQQQQQQQQQQQRRRSSGGVAGFSGTGYEPEVYDVSETGVEEEEFGFKTQQMFAGFFSTNNSTTATPAAPGSSSSKQLSSGTASRYQQQQQYQPQQQQPPRQQQRTQDRPQLSWRERQQQMQQPSPYQPRHQQQQQHSSGGDGSAPAPMPLVSFGAKQPSSQSAVTAPPPPPSSSQQQQQHQQQHQQQQEDTSDRDPNLITPPKRKIFDLSAFTN